MKRPRIHDIDGALLDRDLLGAALGPPQTWRTWLAVLRAAFGLPLGRDDLHHFHEVAGGRDPPRKRVAELWAICGRDSGKSRMAGAIGAYIATLAKHPRKLAPGEKGYVLCLSPTVGQSKLVFDYALAFLEESKYLKQQIKAVTATEIRLHGNIIIATHPCSFRSVRGRTLLACVFDETALWRSEESAQPDIEVYRACLPALARSHGFLCAISTPYRRSGLLHAKHRAHFSQSNDDVLVVQGATPLFNPTVDMSAIARARSEDPQAALSEWDAEFRSDVNQFLDDTVIDRAIDHSRPLELPPRSGVAYVAFTDVSAGRRDSYTLCIAHTEGDGDDKHFVCDVIRGHRAPFDDPRAITREYVELIKQYHIYRVTGDRFSAEWAQSTWREMGVTYEESTLRKSDIYQEGLPHWNRGAIRSIPNLPPLIRELRLLERTALPGGLYKVDAPRGVSEDFANVLAGCVYLAFGRLSAAEHGRRMTAVGDLLSKLCDARASAGPPAVVWSWNTAAMPQSAHEYAHNPTYRAKFNL